MLGLGLGLNKSNYIADSVDISPFGGTYTWWANINQAIHSSIGGIEYIDSIPLLGISDQFEQPNAVNRPEFNVAGLDGNATIKTVSNGQKIYKATDSAVFNGGGTFAFVSKLNSGFTLFTEFTFGYNFQISGNIFYKPADGSLSITTGPTDEFAVHHFSVSDTTLKYYRNSVLKNTYTIVNNMNTLQALCAFSYKAFNAEQGYGEIGDIVALTGTGLDAIAISNDYNNFWKVKYPSLP